MKFESTEDQLFSWPESPNLELIDSILNKEKKDENAKDIDYSDDSNEN